MESSVRGRASKPSTGRPREPAAHVGSVPKGTKSGVCSAAGTPLTAASLSSEDAAAARPAGGGRGMQTPTHTRCHSALKRTGVLPSATCEPADTVLVEPAGHRRTDAARQRERAVPPDAQTPRTASFIVCVVPQ